MSDEACSAPMLVVAALLIENRRVLVSRRPSGKHFGGYWEFPGGKVERGEDPRDALTRELEEELGLQVRIGAVEETVLDRRPKRDVLLLFYHCDRVEGSVPERRQVQEWTWASLGELRELLLPPADEIVIRNLEAFVDP